DGDEDDVSGRPGAERAGGGSAAELVCERSSLVSVAAHDLDDVAVLGRPGADGVGHVARADDADGGHDGAPLVMGGWIKSRRHAPRAVSEQPADLVEGLGLAGLLVEP